VPSPSLSARRDSLAAAVVSTLRDSTRWLIATAVLASLPGSGQWRLGLLHFVSLPCFGGLRDGLGHQYLRLIAQRLGLDSAAGQGGHHPRRSSRKRVGAPRGATGRTLNPQLSRTD
jgi:hypothetical protein